MANVVQIGTHVVGAAGLIFATGTGGGGTVATPTFSPTPGVYATTQTVSISCSTPSSSIYFTIDGTTPTFPITGSTTLYTGSLTVSSTETIKAIGVASGLSNSAVASGTYTISSSTFFSDPFSAFANVIADTTFGGTAGTTTTVSWNGGTISGPTYSTTQAAINALLAAGPGVTGRRVCRLLGQTESCASTILGISGSTASAGFTASLPFVIQGDPICTQAQMPTLDGGGVGHSAYMIGDTINQSGSVTGGFNNTNVIIRKQHITNFQVSGGCSGIHIGAVDGDYTGIVVEFNYIHGFRGSGSDGESGPIYCANSSNAQPGTIRFNKLADTQLVGGGINQNHSAVGLYGGTWQIYNNEMYTCTNGVRFKNNNHNVPTGNQVYNNYIHDVNSGICTASGGEGPSINGIPIFNNLFGWENLNNAVFQGSSAVLNDFGATGIGTLPLTTMFYNNTSTVGWQGGFQNKVTQQCSFYNNVMLCGAGQITCSENGSAGSITFCDFNAYFTGTWIQNLEGSPQYTYSTFAGGSGWQTAFTQHGYPDLTANPDAHGLFIPSQSSPFNTIAGNFPNSSTNDYTPAAGSPLLGAGQSGANMGCNMATVGPGW